MPQIYKSAQAVFGLQRSHGQEWFRIEAKAGAPTQVHIYDEIGMWGISAGQFITDLAAVKGPVEVHLNTPGGEVFDGIAIYNALKNRGDVTIIVDALAASIGSVIAMAAAPGRLLMESTAKMMIHDGFAMAAGNAAELGKMVQQLNEASDTIAGIYATRTGKPQADWRAVMQEETWYSADAAVTAGLADGIAGVTNRTPALILNGWQCRQCHAPAAQTPFCGQCGTAISNAAAPVKLGDDGWVQDPDGKVRFDPDGDGDDDSTAEGDTDHDYWSADGKSIKPVPPRPDTAGDELTDFLVSALRDAAQPHGAMSGSHSHPHPAYGSQGADASHDHSHTHDGDASHSHSHAADSGSDDSGDAKKPFPGAAEPFRKGNDAGSNRVDTGPWNAAQAWHNAATSGDPGAFYAGICAGRRAGDPAQQSSWALPYKYHPDGPPNAAGVAAALERLPETDGLTNTTEATVVLQAARSVADVSAAAAELERATAALAAINAAQAANATVTPAPEPSLRARRSSVTTTDPFVVLMADGVDNTPWNAAKAWHNGAASADPAAFYAGICAGEKAGDKATQAAWALPYRYTPASAPNAAGVKAGLSRLTSTEGLTNEAAAKAKLQGLMAKINPDYEPDDLAELFRSYHALNGVTDAG